MNLYVIISLQLVINLLLFFFVMKQSKQLQQPKYIDRLNKDRKDFSTLSDLLSKSGRVLFEVKRIAPSEYFLRSPKDIN